MIQGTPAAFEVRGIPAGANVRLYREGTGPACPASHPTICTDLSGTGVAGDTVANGSGVARVMVSVPSAMEATTHQWQAYVPACGAVTSLESNVARSSVACAYEPAEWAATCAQGTLGCFLEGHYDTLYPGGFAMYGHVTTIDQVRTALVTKPARDRAIIALQLSIDADDAGLFGARISVGDRVVPAGPHAGSTAREIAVLGLMTGAATSVGDAAMGILQGHTTCGSEHLVMPTPVDPGDTGTEDSGAGDSGVADSGTDDSGTLASTGDTGLTAPDSGTGPSDSGGDSGTPPEATGDTSTIPSEDSGTGPSDSAGDDSGNVFVETGDTGFEDSGVDPDDSGSDSNDSGGSDTATTDTGG